MKQHISDSIKRFLSHLVKGDIATSQHLAFWVMRLAQSARERRNRHMRRDLLQLEEQLGKVLAFSGRME